MQEPKLNLQIYQGAGFQKGGVFNSTGVVGMDRPTQGFMAGAVYGVVTNSPPPGMLPAP